jgi:hypothetical protein
VKVKIQSLALRGCVGLEIFDGDGDAEFAGVEWVLEEGEEEMVVMVEFWCAYPVVTNFFVFRVT